MLTVFIDFRCHLGLSARKNMPKFGATMNTRVFHDTHPTIPRLYGLEE